MSEPVTLRAGDSAAWVRNQPDRRAADGWSLTYRLIPANGLPVNIVAVGDGDNWAVSLLSTATADLPAGNCMLVGVFTRAGGEQVTVYAGSVNVLPNLLTSGAFDSRSQARRALEQLRGVFAAVSADANALTSEYQIAGRMRRFRTVEEIILAISFWEAQVTKEEAAASLIAGGSGSGRVQVRI